MTVILTPAARRQTRLGWNRPGSGRTGRKIGQPRPHDRRTKPGFPFPAPRC